MLPKLKLAKYATLLAIAFNAIIVKQLAIPAERIDFNYSLMNLPLPIIPPITVRSNKEP